MLVAGLLVEQWASRRSDILQVVVAVEAGMLSAKEITHRVDMPNSSFFGKFVKQHLGCTPMEFRNKQTNSQP